jgi:single-strand DNA-binding protein
MSDLNQTVIQGRLTREIETRYATSGTAVGNFGVASNRKYKDQEEVTFLDCTAFGKQCEIMSQHLHKGSQVLLRGRLKTDSWEDKKTNQKKSKLVLIVEDFHFVGGGKTGGEAAPAQESPAKTPPASPIDDSDVPF